MDLVITFLNDKFSLRVALDTTVGELKALIEKRQDVPCEKQRLTGQNGQRVDLSDDTKTLQQYGLKSGSMVMVLITEPPPTQVFLKNDKGQTHTYDVSLQDTVAQFKRKVYNVEKVPVDQQRLIHEGIQMEDEKTLQHCGVKNQSTIFLNLRLRGGL